MRNASTPSPMFRNACSELGRLLIYEAVREFLPTLEGVVDTPLGPADVKVVDPSKPIKVRDAWVDPSKPIKLWEACEDHRGPIRKRKA
eukprot:1159512-Pelagomonas_calceolata.AAC.9